MGGFNEGLVARLKSIRISTSKVWAIFGRVCGAQRTSLNWLADLTVGLGRTSGPVDSRAAGLTLTVLQRAIKEIDRALIRAGSLKVLRLVVFIISTGTVTYLPLY